ncbi:MAG TPA: hypothetical protein VHL09_14585 [Dehalococcoidia bacterium]|nr:hypothetical protein [Dehalococcoidia bacterium]
MQRKVSTSTTVARLPADLVAGAAAGALAGGLAALAYLAEMYADMAVLNHHYDEVRVIGRAITRDRWWPVVGVIGNLLAGAGAGAFYGAFVAPRFRVPPVAGGLIFAQIENGTLYPPVMPLIDRFHPDIRQGLMPRSFTPLSFVEAVLRHVAYGVALGWLYPRVRQHL